MTWMQPTTVDAVVRARADNPEAVVVAGGTFLGILVRAGMLEADDWISLQDVRELTRLHSAGDLSIGAMVRHRRLELDQDVRGLWPGVAAAFRAVASPRVRNVATVGEDSADADRLDDLRSPPGNRLEALKGNRQGQFSIRINDQWRVCFRWVNGAAEDVEIVDYHG